MGGAGIEPARDSLSSTRASAGNPSRARETGRAFGVRPAGTGGPDEPDGGGGETRRRRPCDMPQGSQHDGASARPRAFSATRTPSRSFSRASPCRDGEEFVVIAPEVGDDAALAAGAERLRRLFADELLEAGAHRLP